MAGKSWLMGIDIGGSGVRCLLVDSATRAVTASARPLRFTPAPGTFGTGHDIDLEALWQALGDAARDAVQRAGIAPQQIAALSVSAMRFSTVVLDRDGKPLLAAPNIDARAAGECFEIADQLGASLLEATGSCALPMHTGARLKWLQKQLGGSLAGAATAYGVGEWLTERLCGARAMDASQASATGLLQLAQREWAWSVIDALELPRELFPPLYDAGAALGALSETTAAELGLATGTPVGMGGGDTQLSLLGANAIETGQCAMVGGTTAPVQVVCDRPIADPAGSLQGAHHAVPGRWVVESNGGAMGHSISTMARTLFPESPEPELRLFAEAAQSEPGAAGMLSTLGADMIDMAAPSMPVGQITMSHMGLGEDAAPRRHLARAVVEGCACALRANRERLAAIAGVELDRDIIFCGGLSRSDTFGQLLADISDCEVAVAAPWQTTALGAAICAGVAAATFRDFDQACAALCGERTRFAPRETAREENRQLFTTWQRFREQAQAATVAVDHLMPRVLREAPPAPQPGVDGHRPAALISASFDEASLERLRAHMDVTYASFRESRRLLTGADLVEALAGVQVFVTEVDVVDARALAQLPDLRIVAACRGDAVNVDVEACTAYGIPVLFAPGRNAIAVADLAVGFMINLARKLPAASEFLRQEDCTAGNMAKMGQAFSQLQGNELWRKTVGLVGLGAVGRAVAGRLAGFEVELLVADPFVTPEQAALAGCRLTDLDTLLARSDFVSLHAAVTPETRGMIGAAQFERMKPGAFFINTARAALIDEQALVDALGQGHIAGAALDTFAEEPPGFDHPLVQHPGVIATPHSAGNTREVAAHQGESVSSALLQLLAGGRPNNVLNPQALDGFSWEGPRPEPDPEELERLAQKSGPAVTDLQRDAKAADSRSGADTAPAADITAPADVVEKMTAILERFCTDMAADDAIVATSADRQVTLQFSVLDLGLDFHIGLDNGQVLNGLGPAPAGADVYLEMRAEILDGMFAGTIDTMECAMNGEISFRGDTTKAMTLQQMNADMARLYKAAREAEGDPGDLAAIPRPGAAAATPAAGDGDIREDLVQIMQELYEGQVITATGGNISVRIPDTDDQAWITPSRLFKGDLKPDVMVRINLEGEALDRGSRSPSSEWCMHTRIFEVKQEANAVIHAHAPNATILANADLPFLPISTEAAFFGNIPRIPFIMPGTAELADAVAEAMQDEWAALMINHGIIVAGRSLRRAADMVEIIERTAEVILGCYAVGREPPVLPEDAASYFRKLGDIVA